MDCQQALSPFDARVFNIFCSFKNDNLKYHKYLFIRVIKNIIEEVGLWKGGLNARLIFWLISIFCCNFNNILI
jgi:hypothetical protein